MNQNKQSIEEAIRDTIIRFTYMSFIIGLAIGLIFSYIPKNPIITILIGITGTLIQRQFEPLNKLISKHSKEIKQKVEEHLNEIQEKSEERLNENKNIAYLNYLAIVNNITGIENINNDHKFQFEHMSINEFKDSLKKRNEYFEASNKAITGLLGHVNTKDGNPEETYITLMAREAVENIVEDCSKEEIYDVLVDYLNAWLICSIKYETEELPVHWIKPRNENIETIIEGLTFIKKDINQDIFWQEEMNVPKQSIIIIEKYLEILIYKLPKILINSKTYNK